MQIKLKGLHSPDTYDLENYSPKDKTNFEFFLQLFIGVKGELGYESFDVMVYSSSKNINDYKLQNSIVLNEYNYENLIQIINSKINSIKAEDWKSFANKMIGNWEFQNYQEK